MRAINNGWTIAFLFTLTLPLLTSAANLPTKELILLVRPEAIVSHTANNTSNSLAPLTEIQRLAPNLTPLVPPSRTRTVESLQALQRHRLDRYFVIDVGAMSQQQVKQLTLQLRQLPSVESVEPGPRVDGMRADTAEPIRRINPQIPDYTPRQHYLQGRQAVSPYAIGGVNAVEAWKVPGGKGQGMRVISSEVTHWSYEHIDLPPPYTELTAGAVADYHATASVGVIASRENGFGTTGIVPLAQVGYLQWSDARLVQMAERLEAGDVIQLGVQYNYTPFPDVGCTTNCMMPLEYNRLVRDTITYLTEEKGIHVVLAASNGNINLDHPYFSGYFDPDQFDSGSIYAGAVNPDSGLRSYFSQYGRRVDVFSWGAKVTTTTHSATNPTTGYTHTYSGTSSSNPIITGVVAALQGVARAKGLGNLPPKKLRAYLVATGYPQANGNRTEIGVQPDLDAAIQKMLADNANLPPTGRLALPEEVQSAQTFTAHIHAESPSNRPLTYRWNAAGFKPDTGNEATLILQAPTVAADTRMSISVEVSDGTQSITLTDSLTLKAAPISATLITPATAVSADLVPVRVEARSATGKPLSYAWSASTSLQGSPGNAASGHFIAAPVQSEVLATVFVTVQDGTDTLRTPTNVIKIRPRQDGTRPVPVITGPGTIEAGKPLLLSATASTGSNLRFSWFAQGFTPETSTRPTQTFVAPDTAGQYSVRVTAVDDANQAEVADHPVTVTAPPAPGQCADTAPWDATRLYQTYGEPVSYNGKLYKQNFYNINEQPDINSADFGKPWLTGVDCP